VSFIRVPVHVGIAGNERADLRRDTLLWAIWCTYNAQSVARDLLPIANQRVLDERQKNWEVTQTGRFSHSIFPRVSLRPWSEE
jgi:hypothetical protein